MKNLKYKIISKASAFTKKLSIVFSLTLVGIFCVSLFGTKLYAQDKLTLSDAINISLKNNYNIIITKNSEKIAKINNTWGNTSLMPRLDFSLSGQTSKNYNDTEDFKTLGYSPKLSLSWTLFDGFSAQINKSNYVELERLSEGNTSLLVEETIQNIILAYNNCLLQKELVDVYKDMSDLSRDRMKKAEASKEIGATTSYTYLLYKTSYLKDYSDYLEQKVVYENAVRTLNYNMATDNNKLWNLITPLVADTNDYILSDLTEKLKSNNQSLKNQYISQKILALKTKSAKSAFYPTLSLNAYAKNNKMSTSYDNTADRDNDYNETYAGLNLSWNIFNGGIDKRAVQIAKINEQTADVKTEEMLHSLSNELCQIFSSYNTNKEIYTLNVERLKTAKLNLDIAKDKYTSGAINSFDYRDIQQNYLSAAVEKLSAAFNLIKSNTDLMQITGNIVSYK